ncbi:hypothetical protein F2Q68_00013909 [Brassica cretica]|uniref:Uncharacterized protein n=1 Tax=Brassica cretica TaxID=69181 RepID=A0A8S9HDB3_BRACR|nr:hypothetical protein F2Q68_00013909 [Brassica cretica]
MARSELLVSTPTSPSSMDLPLESTMPSFFKDGHENVENNQRQLLDAMYEPTIFLERFYSRLNVKLLLGLEMTWEKP